MLHFARVLGAQPQVWAYPIYEEFGYADYIDTKTMNIDEYGSLGSGPSGSGIYPAGFLLMAAGTIVFFTRMALYVATTIVKIVTHRLCCTVTSSPTHVSALLTIHCPPRRPPTHATYRYDAQKNNPEIQVLGIEFFLGTGSADGYDDDLTAESTEDTTTTH